LFPRVIGIGLALAVLMAAVCACAPHSTRPPCPQGQQCLFVGNGAEPHTLDPALADYAWEMEVLNDLMVGLTANDAAGQPIPGIATSWDTSPDGLTWTFHLRDALWSDGMPVTAADFVVGMQRALDPRLASDNAALLYIIHNAEAVNSGAAPPSALGVEAIDPHTLRIDLDHPAPYLPQLAKHPVMMPTPRQALAKWGDAWAQPGHYVSDGAYTLVDWKQNDHLTVTRNPRFYDPANICLDRIAYYPVDDKIAAERRVRKGEFDFNGQNGIAISRVPLLLKPDQIPTYVHTHTGLETEYLQFNIKGVPAFRDRRVRQALTMAIDRDFIAGKLFRGVFTPANVLVPPGIANYPGGAEPFWTKWPLAQRQAYARQLLAAAGYGPGGRRLKTSMTLRTAGDPGFYPASIQADWKAIGVDVELLRNDASVAYQTYRAGNFDIANPGWSADYNDAMTFLNMLITDPGTLNYGRYHNPAYDALIAKAEHDPDLVRRGAEMAQAEHIMLEDAAVAPLWFTSNTNLVNPRITGFVDNAADFHPSRFLCFAGVHAPAR
jgi:oligopeptide transport system substrate-binding protein